MQCFLSFSKVKSQSQSLPHRHTHFGVKFWPPYSEDSLRDSFLCHLFYTLLSPRGWRGQILARQMELWERRAGHMQVVREGFSPAGSLRRRPRDPALSPCLLEVIPYMPLKMRMTCCLTVELNGCLKIFSRDFPGGPVVKTPCSACQGPRFNPWSVTKILQTTRCGQGHGESRGVLTRFLYLHDIVNQLYFNQLYLWFSNSTSYLYMPEQNTLLP